MSGEQTEKATPRKRRKASDQGDRLISRELLSSAALAAGILTLGAVGGRWLASWDHAYQQSLDLAGTVEPLVLMRSVRTVLVPALYPALAVGCAACASALALGLAQGGGAMKAAALSLRWSRLSPAANAGHLFSQQALARLLKSSLPVGAIAALALGELRGLATLPVLSLARLPATFAAAYRLLLEGALMMLAWSSVDFLSTWWARERRLRMSKQDVKDESKEAEGSPQVKRRIRSIQRQMRGRKLRADVSKATVVVTNPTHYAVALSFDFATMDPPRVLAKGRDLIAAEIREEARWAGIPLIENPTLARSLYKMVEPGQSIPLELYAAVAGILAYLYRAEVEQRLRTRAPQSTPPPTSQPARQSSAKPGAPGRPLESRAGASSP